MITCMVRCLHINENDFCARADVYTRALINLYDLSSRAFYIFDSTTTAVLAPARMLHTGNKNMKVNFLELNQIFFVYIMYVYIHYKLT